MSEMSSLDTLLLAIEIEEIGKEYYTRAAAHTDDISLRKMLTELASMENDHATLFRKMFGEKRAEQNRTEAGLGKPHTSPELTGYLKYLIDLDIFRNILNDMPKTTEEILKIGIESEKNAIIFYTEIKNMTSDDETHGIIEKILHQEKTHFMQLSEKLKNLRNRP